MKIKAFLKSKGFIVGVLVFVALCILGVCIYVSVDRSPVFVPEGDASIPSASAWSEVVPSSAVSSENMPKDDPEAYPKVIASDDNGTELDFAPVDSSTEPPPAPSAAGDYNNPDAPPEYSEEDTKPPPANNGPAPGATNGQGQIYDPVFGWITPGAGNGVPVDNGGDPDKQVGDM